MKIILNPGMVNLEYKNFGGQFYCPIITLTKRTVVLSFSTVLVIKGKTGQFVWSVGFQILGFGFGVRKYAHGIKGLE